MPHKRMALVLPIRRASFKPTTGATPSVSSSAYYHASGGRKLRRRPWWESNQPSLIGSVGQNGPNVQAAPSPLGHRVLIEYPGRRGASGFKVPCVFGSLWSSALMRRKKWACRRRGGGEPQPSTSPSHPGRTCVGTHVECGHTFKCERIWQTKRHSVPVGLSIASFTIGSGHL